MSLGQDNWNKAKDFVKHVVSSYEVGPGQMQFSIICYTDEAFVAFKLNDFYNEDEIMSAIDGLSLEEGGSNIAAGLRLVRTDVLLSDNGDRSLARNIVILLADGPPTVEQQFMRTEGFALKMLQETDLVVVKISDAINEAVFDEMASSPEHIFTADSFNELGDLEGGIKAIILSVMPTTPPTMPPTTYTYPSTSSRPTPGGSSGP